MVFETTKKRLTTFAAISLTDIVFLLLIFFLLSSTFVVQPGIKVRLPKAITATAESKGRIHVTITAEKDIFLNQEKVTKTDLGRQIFRLLQEDQEQVVVIQADKDLTLETTIEVIDIVKMAGAEKFIIATRPG